MEAIPNQRSIIVELPLIVPDENEREIEVKLRNYFHSKHGDECDVQFREECVTGSRYTVAFVEESGKLKFNLKVKLQNYHNISAQKLDSSFLSNRTALGGWTAVYNKTHLFILRERPC